jgi:uncharacterized protein (DUF849 family)
MPRAGKVIISCAITGSIHTPSMSEHLPVTPDEIAKSAIEAAEAGAAILHLHARVPQDGRPTPDPDTFLKFLPRIKQASDAIVNITTGGSHYMSLDQRLAAAKRVEPEMTSLNMGSMNFGLFPMLDRPRNWKFDWEKQHLNASRDVVFKNTFADVERILREVGEERGARFEFECYDVGHLYNLAHFLERKLVQPPLFVQFVLGVLGGMGAEPECLAIMKATADRLLGDSYQFSVAAAGRAQFALVTMAAIQGGHVRVGLEDNLYIAKGELAPSNAAQVRKMTAILEALSLPIATPQDVRVMLHLKGQHRVKF